FGPDRSELLARGAASARRPLPEELGARELAQLHLGHAHLVSRRRACQHRQPCEQHCQQPGLHFAAASCLTVYFLSKVPTAAVRCSAMTASVQSCSTTPRSLSKSAGLGGVTNPSCTARQPSLVASACHRPAGALSSSLANASP